MRGLANGRLIWFHSCLYLSSSLTSVILCQNSVICTSIRSGRYRRHRIATLPDAVPHPSKRLTNTSRRKTTQAPLIHS
ncbi:hypothetical protein B0H67DRAFT_565046 [Lasiosphaeris hirsuta]|uniref:Secreted protein n=1 Tax=Lasiosphaeris hirsuta TaxID=260670 RepID=A0AA40EDP1_9PEZI|nr:hypothetical protein B0H67DRAFT_565046 [Lasiosphaeris hirsuta]